MCVCLKADAKKKKMDRDDEEKSQQMIEDQIVRAMAAKKVRKRERQIYLLFILCSVKEMMMTKNHNTLN